ETGSSGLPSELQAAEVKGGRHLARSGSCDITLTRRRPMSRSVWTVLAGMILSGTASAAVISTGIGSALNDECNVASIGAKPVTVKSVTVIDALGAVHSPTSSNCTFPGQISPGLDCSISVGAQAGFGHLMRCVIDTSSKSSIRATMMFFDSGSAGNTIILEAH